MVFLELLFSPFTENFASAVNKEIKIFSLSDCMIKRSNCQIVYEFFSKKICKIDEKILWKGLLILTQDEKLFNAWQGQELILPTFVG